MQVESDHITISCKQVSKYTNKQLSYTIHYSSIVFNISLHSLRYNTMYLSVNTLHGNILNLSLIQSKEIHSLYSREIHEFHLFSKMSKVESSSDLLYRMV